MYLNRHVQQKQLTKMTRLQMKNRPTCSTYTFAAMEIVGLLQWNIGNGVRPLRRISDRKIFGNAHITSREAGSFPRANSEREQRR